MKNSNSLAVFFIQNVIVVEEDGFCNHYPTLFQGEAGALGPKGSEGAKGHRGEVGSAGIPGERGQTVSKP